MALSLPHALEKPHFERTSFRVNVPRGKIFVTLAGDGASANLMLTPDQQSILCDAEPTMFAPVPNKWGEKGATCLTLATVDAITLRSALRQAWKHAAPEKFWRDLAPL